MMRSAVSLAVAAVAISAPARAEQIHQFDIPPGSLQQAIIAVGQQGNASIALGDARLSRITVRRVRGRMTVPQALRRLLTGTPATFVALGDSTYRIVRAPVRPRTIRPSEAAPSRTSSTPPARSRPSPPQPEEIIVTGSKRGTPLRDYPGPAVVLGASDFTPASAAEGTSAIMSRVPSLGSTHLGTGRNKLFIRGIADSSFNGPTQSTVGQYFGEVRLNYSAPDPDLRLYDIAAVELLPGPQGTLYGAGSMGGVLRIVPNAPDRDEASTWFASSVAATAHGEPGGELAAGLNLPLIAGRTAVRAVAYRISEGGYIDELRTGEDDVNRTGISGGRVALSASLSGGWDVEAGLAAQRIDGEDAQYATRSEPPLTRRSNVRQPFSNDYALAHAAIRGRWDDYRLTSAVSAVRQDLTEHFDATDLGGRVEVFRQRNRFEMHSLETRLTRDWKSGGGWLAGVSVLRNRSRLDRASGPPGALESLPGVRNRLDERTLFGEVTRPLTSSLELTGGLRLSHVAFEGFATGPEASGPDASGRISGSHLRLLPSAALGATLGGNAYGYLRYQESFRPGGIVVRANAGQELDSDEIRALEGGLRFGQDRLSRLSGMLSASYSRWTDLQADLIDQTGQPATVNLGNGEVWALDGALSWHARRNFHLTLAATANHSRLLEFGPSIQGSDAGIFVGGRLPNVPDFAATASVDHSRSVGLHRELQLSARARYVGDSKLGVGPVLSREQGEYLDTALEARLRSRRWEVFALLTNLLDQVGNRFALGSVLRVVDEDQVTPLRPRTFRVGVLIRP